MRDISDAADLMLTARETLMRELLPVLPAQHKYSALMIANGMAIAARESRLGGDAARSEAARLRNLLVDRALPLPASTELADLRRAVCRAIRAGSFDADEDASALTSALSHTAEAWVAISNPKALRPTNA